jgi:hypothetical protein
MPRSGSLHGRLVFSARYGRRTQALKLKDIDVITVVEDPDGTRSRSASGTLGEVQKALAASDLVRQAVPKVRAVKAFLKDYEFTFDFVPAHLLIVPGELRQVPVGETPAIVLGDFERLHEPLEYRHGDSNAEDGNDNPLD